MCPASREDYRKLTKYLDDQKHQYFTFTFQSEKDLLVVLKGMPEGIEIEEIKEDLLIKGFTPKNVKRMTKGPDKKPMPLLLRLRLRPGQSGGLCTSHGTAIPEQPTDGPGPATRN